MLRQKHFNKMFLTAFWIVLLGCLNWCHAAPTVAPTVSPVDQELAEVMQCTLRYNQLHSKLLTFGKIIK